MTAIMLAAFSMVVILVAQLPVMLYSFKNLEFISSADIFIGFEVLLVSSLVACCFVAREKIYLVNLIFMAVLLLDLIVNNYFFFIMGNPFYFLGLSSNTYELSDTVRFANRDYMSLVAVSFACIAINFIVKRAKKV